MKEISLVCFFGGFLLVYSQLNEKPVYDLKDAQIHFEGFINKFQKQYLSEKEKQYRFSIFKKNLMNINQQNANNPQAWFSINAMSDLKEDEFLKMYTGLVFNETGYDDCKKLADNDILPVQAPENFDWRQKNVVSPVKDQANCGSCWAFSTVGNIESMNAIKTGQVVTASEQQLVDCNLDNDGCNGGYMSVALSYIASAGGIMSEQEYPYEAARNSCRFDQNKAVIKISGCNKYNLKNEEKLKDLLYSNGPLSIGICADDIRYYTGGIVNSCCNDYIDHAVLLVGYGVENGVPYWLIKNSWSTTWGEQGYFRLQRGANMCGILNDLTSSAVI